MFTTQNIHELLEADNKVTLNPEQEEKLAVELTAAGYPGRGILSLDGLFYTTSAVNKGRLLFDEYKKYDDRSLLAISCMLGSFDALAKRTELNKAIIKDATSSAAAKAEAKLELDVDLKKLGELYWTVGYLHSARILLDLGNHFKSKENASAQDYYNRAGSCYYLAEALQTESKEMMAIIYQEEGFKASGWPSMSAAAQDLLYNVSLVDRHGLEQAAKKEISDYAKVAEEDSPRQKSGRT